MTKNSKNQTLADGNCAYNAIALFFRDCFLTLPENHPQIATIIKRINDREHYNICAFDMKKFMQEKSPVQIQNQFAPIFRSVFAGEIHNPEHHFQEILLENLEVMREYMQNNPEKRHVPYADVFMVHPFIKQQLTPLPSGTALAEWWNQTGFEQYCEAVSSPASSANDVARWGAEPELDILGKVYGFKIIASKDNRGQYQYGDLNATSDIVCRLNLAGNHWSYIPMQPPSCTSSCLQGLFKKRRIVIEDQDDKPIDGSTSTTSLSLRFLP